MLTRSVVCKVYRQSGEDGRRLFTCLSIVERDTNAAKNQALLTLLLGRDEASVESYSSAQAQAAPLPQPMPSVFVSAAETQLRANFAKFEVALTPRERFVEFIVKRWRASAKLPDVHRLWRVLRHVNTATVDGSGMTTAKPLEVFAAARLPKKHWPSWCDEKKCTCSRSSDPNVRAAFRDAVLQAKNEIAQEEAEAETHDDEDHDEDDDSDDGGEREDEIDNVSEGIAIPGPEGLGRH